MPLSSLRFRPPILSFDACHRALSGAELARRAGGFRPGAGSSPAGRERWSTATLRGLVVGAAIAEPLATTLHQPVRWALGGRAQARPLLVNGLVPYVAQTGAALAALRLGPSLAGACRVAGEQAQLLCGGRSGAMAAWVGAAVADYGVGYATAAFCSLATAVQTASEALSLLSKAALLLLPALVGAAVGLVHCLCTAAPNPPLRADPPLTMRRRGAAAGTTATAAPSASSAHRGRWSGGPERAPVGADVPTLGEIYLAYRSLPPSAFDALAEASCQLQAAGATRARRRRQVAELRRFFVPQAQPLASARQWPLTFLLGRDAIQALAAAEGDADEAYRLGRRLQQGFRTVLALECTGEAVAWWQSAPAERVPATVLLAEAHRRAQLLAHYERRALALAFPWLAPAQVVGGRA